LTLVFELSVPICALQGKHFLFCHYGEKFWKLHMRFSQWYWGGFQVFWDVYVMSRGT